MNSLAMIAGIAAALAVVMTFVWRLEKERREVWNRGVNQSALVTWGRALGYTLYRAVTYALLFYVLVTGYYLVKFRNRCQSSIDARAAYESRRWDDHLLEALRWPVTYRDGPSCLSDPAP